MCLKRDCEWKNGAEEDRLDASRKTSKKLDSNSAE